MEVGNPTWAPPVWAAMSESHDAYPGRAGGYEEAERAAHDLPGQLARLRREARLLRERLFVTAVADPQSHLTAREKAAASDD
jgi:hypothetical protein